MTGSKRPSNPRSAVRTWKPPVITKLRIDRQTMSGAEANDAVPAEPDLPGQPATKLGFSFEMALPLSSRAQK